MQFKNNLMFPQVENGYLTVHGASTIEVPSDRARLKVKVSSQNDSLEEAQEDNDTIVERIVLSLTDYGLSKENVNSSDISVTRNYDYDKNEFTSFTVTRLISIIVDDFSKLSDVYSLIIENGANNEISIEFILSNPSYYYSKALKKASQDALSKANLLAKNFNVKYNPIPYKVTEITSPLYAVTYSSSTTNYYQDITPGLVKINGEVEAVFATYPFNNV